VAVRSTEDRSLEAVHHGGPALDQRARGRELRHLVFQTTITLWVTLFDNAAACAALNGVGPVPDDAAETADDVTSGPATRRRATAPVTHVIFDFRTGCHSLHRSTGAGFTELSPSPSKDRRPPSRHLSSRPFTRFLGFENP